MIDRILKQEPLRHPQSSATADFKWDSILYSYIIYIGVLLIGGFIGIQTSIYGAALFLILLYSRYWSYFLRTKLDFLTYCIFLCLLIPFIPLASFDQKTLAASLQELIKYLALHLVILLGISMPLTPLGRAKKAWILYFTILSFLIIGCLWNIALGHHGPRIQGFLPNPNGFALTAMMLLFLTNNESPRFFAKRASHIVVITLILLSRTSGALLGYLAGFLHLKLFAKKNKRLIGIAFLIVATSLVVALFAAMPKGTVKPLETILDKIAIAEKNLDRVLSGKKIDFYAIIERKGEDVTSGLWRILQWHRILSLFVHSSLDKILFGYGIGTTDIVFMLKAHNDYLRVLLETGVIGLILNLTVWIVLYRRMALKYRWVVIMIAVFCITENNLDHFPAMSLLALYMIGAGGQDTVEKAGPGNAEVKQP